MTAEAIVLGRNIGTHDGWDQVDEEAFVLYDLKPIEGLGIEPGDTTFDYANGLILTHHSDGKEVSRQDIAIVLSLPNQKL